MADYYPTIGEADRLRRDNARLIAACRVAIRRIALLTPLVDDDDPILGEVAPPIAAECDADREFIAAAVRAAGGEPTGMDRPREGPADGR